MIVFTTKMSTPPKKKNPWTPMAAGCIAGAYLYDFQYILYNMLIQFL